MSEYINNVSKRKAALREVIKKLHQGASVESLTEEFVRQRHGKFPGKKRKTS